MLTNCRFAVSLTFKCPTPVSSGTLCHTHTHHCTSSNHITSRKHISLINHSASTRNVNLCTAVSPFQNAAGRGPRQQRGHRGALEAEPPRCFGRRLPAGWHGLQSLQQLQKPGPPNIAILAIIRIEFQQLQLSARRIFHQPEIRWWGGHSPHKLPFGVRSCEVVITHPELSQTPQCDRADLRIRFCCLILRLYFHRR